MLGGMTSRNRNHQSDPIDSTDAPPDDSADLTGRTGPNPMSALGFAYSPEPPAPKVRGVTPEIRAAAAYLASSADLATGQAGCKFKARDCEEVRALIPPLKGLLAQAGFRLWVGEGLFPLPADDGGDGNEIDGEPTLVQCIQLQAVPRRTRTLAEPGLALDA